MVHDNYIILCISTYASAYLVIDDRPHGSIRHVDGGDLSDECSHVCATLQLAISSEGPDHGVEEVARDILLYLVKLTKTKAMEIVFTRERPLKARSFYTIP